MSAPIPVGSRVVLVEDHRATVVYGRKGWRGVVMADDPEDELKHNLGRYDIHFDHGEDFYVNASAVALESPAPAPLDTDALAMALQLADLIDAEFMWLERYGHSARPTVLAEWLRAEVQRELRRMAP